MCQSNMLYALNSHNATCPMYPVKKKNFNGHMNLLGIMFKYDSHCGWNPSSELITGS